jgi:glutamate-1-semialdehyde 2,1-aminomutase
MYPESIVLFERAQHSIPGGVNSPVRAFKGVGGTPLFIKSAKGAYLYDEDGHSYIDFINSWGPMILGHAHEEVIKSVQEQLQYSFSFGAPSRLEIEMAELIRQLCPGIELVRMVNSGTEACMSALRLARGYTGRNKVIKFEGCYHGHADSFLVSAGSGAATLGIQSIPGVTATTASDTLNASFNDISSVQQLIDQHKNQIAAIIIEPVAGNMGCIPPAPGFLQQLRRICDQEDIVLIFDEVMTGFRLARGGAQELYRVNADLVTYGKIIGGGLPVGAYGGKREIMQSIAPLGKVYQAGTLSGNPLAMRAGFTTLQILAANKAIYGELDNKTILLSNELQQVFEEAHIPVCINRAGSMISVHFSNEPVIDFRTASKCDIELFKKYFHYCLAHGIYLPPSAFETWFVSTAITGKDISDVVQATRQFVSSL